MGYNVMMNEQRTDQNAMAKYFKSKNNIKIKY